MDYNCLIVDDERELAETTCEYFQMFDVSCAYVTTAEECLKFLQSNRVDILLLDINLQEESGFNLCKKIRTESDIPILFISARQSDDDVLIALNIGGDDYIKKPYSLSVLLAKVKIMLKRMAAGAAKESIQPKASEEMVLDRDTMKVYVKGSEIQLKSREFKLLNYLYENRNRIVTKDDLFTNVWGNGFFSDGTLNVHIRKLREKIEEDPHEPKYIKTIWGTGYILKL